MNKLIIHYININKNDKFCTKMPVQVNKLKKLYVKDKSITFKIHTYTSLFNEIKEYNKEYSELLSKINPLFATAIADIGRIFVLWKYGGIYHDAHFYIEDNKFLNKIKDTLNIYDYIFERHPSNNTYSCRNGNMASNKNNKLFEKILKKQFKNLERIKKEIKNNSKKLHNIWSEFGMVFLTTLLNENNIDIRKFSINNVPNNENFCIHWKIKQLPRFYNSGMKDHWSVLQKKIPLLLI